MQMDRIAIIVGTVVVVVLQALVAPHIAIGGVVPNFVAAYCMAYAVTRASDFNCLVPFFAGLAFDLLFGGPVGAMALSLLVFSYAAARFFDAMNNDTLFMPLVTCAIGLLLVEAVYGILMLLFGYPVGFFEAIAFRVAPCFIYDLVIAVVLTLVARRLLAPPTAIRSDITQLR